MSPVPASTNCCWTSRTSCGNTVCRNGQKTIPGRKPCGRWERKIGPIGRIRPISPMQGPYAPWLAHADPAVVANAIICLIHQANYLLDRQIAGLERQFIQEGGYSERLAAARIEERARQQIGQIRRIRRIGQRTTLPSAPNAASRWRCGRLAKAGTRGRNSGAVAVIPSAKAFARWRDRTDPSDPTHPTDEKHDHYWPERTENLATRGERGERSRSFSLSSSARAKRRVWK